LVRRWWLGKDLERRFNRLCGVLQTSQGGN